MTSLFGAALKLGAILARSSRSRDSRPVLPPGIKGFSTSAPRLFEQATFVPGSLWVTTRRKAWSVNTRWPSSTPNGVYTSGGNLNRCAVLVPSVRVNGRWLSATPGEPDEHGRIGEWRVWPLEEWAGPARPLTEAEWVGLGFEAVPGVFPSFSDRSVGGISFEEGPRIEGARIRVVVGEPWAAWHPVIEVDPRKPWVDLVGRWRKVLGMLGFTDEQVRQARKPSIFPRTLSKRKHWVDESPDDAGALAGVPGWNRDAEWFADHDGWPLSRIQPANLPTPRIPAVWFLLRDGSYLSLMPGDPYRLPEKPLPFLKDLESAAVISLSVQRRIDRAVLADAASPTTYRATTQLDPTRIDPNDPASFAPFSRAEVNGWFFGAEINRSTAQRVEAVFIGVGPWSGRTASIPLSAGADLSELFANPRLVRQGLRQLGA